MSPLIELISFTLSIISTWINSLLRSKNIHSSKSIHWHFYRCRILTIYKHFICSTWVVCLTKHQNMYQPND
ncbi:unnamed protein product [Rotaria magnacalcarata]